MGKARKKTKQPKSKARLFEELITRIEASFLPVGAKVQSPDRVVDKITGQLREVDASIRYLCGTVEILMTIECRDRVKTDDATWIEQLVAKQRDIGAARTLAVSAKGFSKRAIKKAAHHDILIRRYEDISNEEIENWKRRLKGGALVVYYTFTRLSVQFDPPAPQLQWADEIKEAMAKDQLNTPFVFIKADDRALSLVNLLDSYQARHGAIDEGMAIDEVRSRDIIVTFQPRAAFCKTNQGNMDISLIVIGVAAKHRLAEMQLQQIARYSSDTKIISYVANFAGESGSKAEIIIPQATMDQLDKQ